VPLHWSLNPHSILAHLLLKNKYFQVRKDSRFMGKFIKQRGQKDMEHKKDRETEIKDEDKKDRNKA